MRPALLALVSACSVGSAGACFAQSQFDDLREACLRTEMRREAFERLADERDWEQLLRVVRAGDPLDTTVWESMYRAQPGRRQFWMSGENAGADPAHATSCGVAATDPDADWRSRAGALALELGMTPSPTAPRPNSVEARAWSTVEPTALSLSYDLYPSGLTVRLTRPGTAAE